MVRGFVQRRRFSGGLRMSSMGAEGMRKVCYFFTYVVTAHRRVGWVGDALPFCAALLLPARLLQSGKSYVYDPSGTFYCGLDSTSSL